MLELNKLTVKKDAKMILNEVDFCCKEGEKILIYGPSGSGKSTFLRALLLFEPINSGSIQFNGREIGEQNINDYRKNFVFIGQKAPNFQGKAEDFICLPFTFKNNKFSKPEYVAVEKLLQDFNFSDDVLEKKYENLSGGEQQRLCIIQALLLNKKIFLLDEITSNLDAQNSYIVIHKILQDPNRTVISVSHDAHWQNKEMKKYILAAGELKDE
jgi:putative ABC transport system ATP-binding protein